MRAVAPDPRFVLMRRGEQEYPLLVRDREGRCSPISARWLKEFTAQGWEPETPVPPACLRHYPEAE